jgi:hypothetical protein
MGFANALRIMLAKDQSFGWDLLGFNLGLEAGQIVVVVILLAIAAIILNVFKVNRREWVIFLSAAVFSVALQMAMQRKPW